MKKLLILLLITTVMSINVFFWASQKEGFHVDEMFSYEQVGNTEYPKPEYDRPDEPVLNTWHSREYYEDYLTISETEAFDIHSFYQSASKNTAHPPLYLTFLGMFISSFFQNCFTKWSGLLLNILFFVLSVPLLFDLCKNTLRFDSYSYLTVFLYGINVAVVSMVMFIRPYTMLIFFSIAFLDINSRIFSNKKHLSRTSWKAIRIYGLLASCFIAGAFTHYYFLPFAFFVSIGYVAVFIIIRQFHLLASYIITLLLSLMAYCMLWPNILSDLFLHSRGTEAISNLTSQSTSFGDKLFYYIKMLNAYMFSGLLSRLILIMSLLLIAIFFATRYRKHRINNNGSLELHFKMRPRQSRLGDETVIVIADDSIAILPILFATISQFLIIAKIAPPMPYGNVIYMELRYFSCVFPSIVLLIVYYTKQIILKIDSNHFLNNVIIMSLSLLVLGSYFTTGVDYLYKGADEQLLTLNNYSNDKAIFITDTNYYCSNLNVYFTKTEAVYQTNTSGIDNLTNTIGQLNEREVLLYIDSERGDRHEILSTICEKLRVSDCDCLFETTGLHRSDVYVLHIDA